MSAAPAIGSPGETTQAGSADLGAARRFRWRSRGLHVDTGTVAPQAVLISGRELPVEHAGSCRLTAGTTSATPQAARGCTPKTASRPSRHD